MHSELNSSKIKAVVFDFSRVILFAKDLSYTGDLNPLNRELLAKDPDYQFLDYFVLNKELLDYLGRIKSKRLIIFTSGIVQDAPVIQSDINRVFEAVYSAEKMGISKKEPGGYLHLCQEIGQEPHEVLFIDDSQVNVDAASKAGLHAVMYTDNIQLFSILERV